MLRIDQLRLTPEEPESQLPVKAAKVLRVAPEQILSLQILRRAVDAREQLLFVYTVAVEVKKEEASFAIRPLISSSFIKSVLCKIISI